MEGSEPETSPEPETGSTGPHEGLSLGLEDGSGGAVLTLSLEQQAFRRGLVSTLMMP